MALAPKDLYPGQVDETDAAGYPHGKARNESIPGISRDGTPYEAAWVSDLWGFLQALLAAPATPIQPSNTPDKVGASQYLDALKAIIDERKIAARIGLTAIALGSGEPCDLFVIDDLYSSGFSLATGTSLFVPRTGHYRFDIFAKGLSNANANPHLEQLSVRRSDSQAYGVAVGQRWSASTSDDIYIRGSGIFAVDDTTKTISVVRFGGGVLTLDSDGEDHAFMLVTFIGP